MNQSTKVIIPCRFSFLSCWQAESFNGWEPRYSLSAIIDKSDTQTIKQIKEAIKNAKKEYASKWGGKIPRDLINPLKDGDALRMEDEAYRGCYFLNASSKIAPQVVDRNVQPIINQEEVYSGCYGKISVTFYGYNSNGNCGIGASLGNIQKIEDGEPLFNRANAEEEFGVEM
ncbi:MAG: DUF2815 family protein [Clostridium sp.]